MIDEKAKARMLRELNLPHPESTEGKSIRIHAANSGTKSPYQKAAEEYGATTGEAANRARNPGYNERGAKFLRDPGGSPSPYAAAAEEFGAATEETENTGRVDSRESVDSQLAKLRAANTSASEKLRAANGAEIDERDLFPSDHSLAHKTPDLWAKAMHAARQQRLRLANASRPRAMILSSQMPFKLYT